MPHNKGTGIGGNESMRRRENIRGGHTMKTTIKDPVEDDLSCVRRHSPKMSGRKQEMLLSNVNLEIDNRF